MRTAVEIQNIFNLAMVLRRWLLLRTASTAKECSKLTRRECGLRKVAYYYHSDNLGSASYITNLDGEVVQHIEYVPFGEVFLEERNNTWNTPFLFNGKELDEETELYYYGARYYNPRISLWYGVDPLFEKYPAHSPYCYTMNNPVMLVDPDGRKIKLPKSLTASQRTQIINTIQSLTNYKIFYNSKKSEIRIASLAKSGTETKVNGTRLIRRLNSSSKTVTIDY